MIYRKGSVINNTTKKFFATGVYPDKEGTSEDIEPTDVDQSWKVVDVNLS